jgi:ribosomal protein S27E
MIIYSEENIVPMAKGSGAKRTGRKPVKDPERRLRFYNFPCPACGNLVRPFADGRGRITCTHCGQDITQAVRGMLKVSWLNKVREGLIGFATCGKCGTLVLARKVEGPEDDEYWTCTNCGSLVFV